MIHHIFIYLLMHHHHFHFPKDFFPGFPFIPSIF